MQRAQDLNEEADCPIFLAEIILFGSVLWGADPVGDADLHLRFVRRKGWSRQWAQDWAQLTGRGWTSYVPHWDAARSARLILRDGKQVLRFVENDPEREGWPCRTIWRCQPSDLLTADPRFRGYGKLYASA